MAADDFKPKLGRIREPKKRASLRPTRHILTDVAKSCMATRPHPAESASARHWASGVLAIAGLIASANRRGIVHAPYARQRRGDLGSARVRRGLPRAGKLAVIPRDSTHTLASYGSSQCMASS